MSTGATDHASAPEINFIIANTAPRPADAGSDPDLYYPIWWKFTSPIDGQATVDAFATTPDTADTKLKVYAGLDAIAGNDYAAYNDDAVLAGDTLLSRVTFRIFTGTVYYIQVGSYDTSSDLPDTYGVTISNLLQKNPTPIIIRPVGEVNASDSDPIIPGHSEVVGTTPWADDSDATYAKILWRYPDAFNGGATGEVQVTLPNVVEIGDTITCRIAQDAANPFEYLFTAGLSGAYGSVNTSNSGFISNTSPESIDLPIFFGGAVGDPGYENTRNGLISAASKGLADGVLVAGGHFDNGGPLIGDLSLYFYLYEIAFTVYTGTPWSPELRITGQTDRTRVRPYNDD